MYFYKFHLETSFGNDEKCNLRNSLQFGESSEIISRETTEKRLFHLKTFSFSKREPFFHSQEKLVLSALSKSFLRNVLR